MTPRKREYYVAWLRPLAEPLTPLRRVPRMTVEQESISG